LFFTGIAGWIIGGLAAVIDATISNNFILHNTLWVPAHFHTYNAFGNVLFSFAFFHWFANRFSGGTQSVKVAGWMISFLLIGGVGFLLAFYIGGAHSIPRRFNIYPIEFTQAPFLAFAAAIFAMAYFTAILILFINVSKKCVKILFSSSSH
jgi:cytochrome c oxidase subunit 1